MLDPTDIAILRELQANARIPTAELGRRVSLSAPSVAERIRRMEDAGVIEGYSARVNLRQMGYGLEAVVTLTLHDDAFGDMSGIAAAIEAQPEVVAAFRVTGPDCVVLRLAVRDVQHLEDVINRLALLGRTATAVVLATVVRDRPLLPPGEAG